jgi:5,6-dimethylbenzimidazole synthase
MNSHQVFLIQKKSHQRKENKMEFNEFAKARRSHRSFDTSPVSEDQLQAILEAGCWAPSPLNLQPWQFIIVTDPKVKSQIKQVAETAKQEVMDKDGPGWAAKYGMDFLEEAPVLVVVVVNPSKGGLGDFFGQKDGAMQAASACIQNMMLAASEMGLGTLWFTFFRPENLKTALGISENLEVAGIVPIGTPKDEVKTPPRKDAKIQREQYGADS